MAAGCAKVSPAGALAIGGLDGGPFGSVRGVAWTRCSGSTIPCRGLGARRLRDLRASCAWLFFADPDYGGVAGLLHGGGLPQFVGQTVGAGAVFVWSFGCGLLLFALAHITLGLRAPVATRPAGSTGAGAGEP
jgi:Amt family ammonium transporter